MGAWVRGGMEGFIDLAMQGWRREGGTKACCGGVLVRLWRQKALNARWEEAGGRRCSLSLRTSSGVCGADIVYGTAVWSAGKRVVGCSARAWQYGVLRESVEK